MERWTDRHMRVEINLFFPGLVFLLCSGWVFSQAPTGREAHEGRGKERERKSYQCSTPRTHSRALLRPEACSEELRHAHLHAAGNTEPLPPPRGHRDLRTWAFVRTHHRSSQKEVCTTAVISSQKPHRFVLLAVLAPRHSEKTTLSPTPTGNWWEVILHYMISEMNWKLCALCPLIFLVKNITVKTATTCQKCPICSLTEKDKAFFPAEETRGFLTTFIPPEFCWHNYSFQSRLILWPLKIQED